MLNSNKLDSRNKGVPTQGSTEWFKNSVKSYGTIPKNGLRTMIIVVIPYVVPKVGSDTKCNAPPLCPT